MQRKRGFRESHSRCGHTFKLKNVWRMNQAAKGAANVPAKHNIRERRKQQLVFFRNASLFYRAHHWGSTFVFQTSKKIGLSALTCFVWRLLFTLLRFFRRLSFVFSVIFNGHHEFQLHVSCRVTTDTAARLWTCILVGIRRLLLPEGSKLGFYYSLLNSLQFLIL